jgi:hypothetical protein
VLFTLRRGGPQSRSQTFGGRHFVLIVVGLVACKGGGTTGTFGFLPPHAAPPPQPGSVLSAVSPFVPTNQIASIQAQAQTLLTTVPKYAVQAISNWSIVLNTGQTVSGLNSDPIRHSGAAFAHAAGVTGAGQTVVVVDTHINLSHEAFTGKTQGTVGLATANSALTPDPGENNHGTQVASVVGGNSASMIGIAPGANILFGDFATDASTTAATNAAIAANAVAMNNSWGYDSLTVGTPAFQTLFSSPSGAAYLNALRTYSQTGVVVFAVSNDDARTHASIMDALPYVDPSLEAGWIAVGNAVPVMNGAGDVQSVTLLSSGCWEAARWCMLADGTWNHMATTHLNGGGLTTSNVDYAASTGSSFAAPQVSGALALLAQAFPTLNPHQLRVRLMASADNGFFTPDATVELATGFHKGFSYRFGVGFLDIEAALQPIGPSKMSLPDGSVQLTSQPVIVAGTAMGDAVTRSLASIDVAVTDALDAPFLQRGDSLATSAAPAPLSRTLLARSAATDLGSARDRLTSALGDPFASFSGATWKASAPDGSAEASVLMTGSEGFGLGLRRALTDGPTRIEVGLKLARDGGSVMGFGGIGQAATDMASLELGITQDLGSGAFLSLGGEIGLADLGDQAMLTSISAARYDSMSLQFGTRDAFSKGDRLALGLSLPMAVTGGSAEAILPVASAAGTDFTPVEIDLSPSDRQMDIALSYQTPLSDQTELLAQLVHARNFGNQAGAEDTAAVLALSFSF